MKFLRRRLVEILFVTAILAIYIFFCAPGMTWGDGVFLALAVEDQAGLVENYGGHPVYRAAARAFKTVFPFGDVVRRLNIFSSIAGAGAVALFLVVLFQLGLSRGGALCGAALLAFSHLFWFHAEVAEIYSLFACFFFGTVALLLRYLSDRTERSLQFLLLVAGLACGCHPLIILAYPAIAIAVWRNPPAERRGWKGITRCTISFLAGLSPVIYIFVLGAASGGIRHGFLTALFLGRGKFAGTVFGLEFIAQPGILARNLLMFGLSWLYQLAGVAVVLVVIGIPRLWRRHRELALFVVVTAVVNFLFAIDYSVSDQIVFFTPIFLLSAIAGAVGAERTLERFRRKRPAAIVLAIMLAVVPAVSYMIAPRIYRGLGLRLAGFHAKPYRDPVVYFLVPIKRDYMQIERYVEKVLSEAPRNVTIFLDSPDYLFLQYYQYMRKIRQDVKARHFSVAGPLKSREVESLSRLLTRGPVIVGPAYVKVLEPYFELERLGLTSRVVGRNKGQ